MGLTSLIIAIAIIVAIFLVMYFVMKVFKKVIVIAVIVIVLGIWFYGFSGFFDKISEAKDNIPELEMQKIAMSITGCTADEDCAYITNPGDCRMTAEYCNNIAKEDNYKKMLEEEIIEEECNKTSVQLDPLIKCECKLHKEREGRIKQWFSKKIEQKAGYTFCWKKD